MTVLYQCGLRPASTGTIHENHLGPTHWIVNPPLAKLTDSGAIRIILKPISNLKSAI